mgnify:CR=1 FL=1
MASDKAYLQFILEQLSGLDGIAYRPMMGEFILYLQGKVIGGIYDNRLLVKPVGAAAARIPARCSALPYPGAKPMLLVENVDDRTFLCELFAAMYDELPAPKPKKRSPARTNGR